MGKKFLNMLSPYVPPSTSSLWVCVPLFGTMQSVSVVPCISWQPHMHLKTVTKFSLDFLLPCLSSLFLYCIPYVRFIFLINKLLFFNANVGGQHLKLNLMLPFHPTALREKVFQFGERSGESAQNRGDQSMVPGLARARRRCYCRICEEAKSSTGIPNSCD